MNQHVTVIDTPEGISAFRLLSLRGMLKLERLGMKTRGGSLRPRIAAEFGLKPRASHDAYIAVIEERLAVIRGKLEEKNA